MIFGLQGVKVNFSFNIVHRFKFYWSTLFFIFFIKYYVLLKHEARIMVVQIYICLTSLTRAKPKEKMEFPT